MMGTGHGVPAGEASPRDRGFERMDAEVREAGFEASFEEFDVGGFEVISLDLVNDGQEICQGADWLER